MRTTSLFWSTRVRIVSPFTVVPFEVPRSLIAQAPSER